MKNKQQPDTLAPEKAQPSPRDEAKPYMLPLPNYTLSTVCPACNAFVVRRACKVRCERCGFMWDCSET